MSWYTNPDDPWPPDAVLLPHPCSMPADVAATDRFRTGRPLLARAMQLSGRCRSPRCRPACAISTTRHPLTTPSRLCGDDVAGRVAAGELGHPGCRDRLRRWDAEADTATTTLARTEVAR
jgi:hypothetical protein